MNLNFETEIASAYKSSSQIARVLTEDWVLREGYCPSCSNNLTPYKNNNPVGDFSCLICSEDYELKAKKDKVAKKINDGAYSTMIERLGSQSNPNFFFISYNSKNWAVDNFLIIPKHFFTPEIIEKRKPLSQNAKRAGWVGCNVLLGGIPESGKIYYVKNGKVYSRASVKNEWNKTLFLREAKSSDLKGWILDIMNCVDKLGKKEFRLDELYAYVDYLKKLHPNNQHVKDKIRQQLQFLRDKDYLVFIGNGKYKLT